MKEREIRSRLESADESLQDLRSEMENDIRDFMVNVLHKDTIEVEVFESMYHETHKISITIIPLSLDGDGDADLSFNDYETGGTNMSIRDAELSTDLLAGICNELFDMQVGD